jgi:FAD/FMN-containing dehydrogenase/ferredoxin
MVVDFSRMDRILAVDAGAQTVTVEAGVIWKHLEAFLGEHDLALRSYPTSFPGSTVGGWLAQGGAGIGSYCYGWFSENVVGARVVLPNGLVKEFTGGDLELISDAEGITGFITQVTLQVRKRDPEAVAAASFPEASALARALEAVYQEKLPLWSVSFINPKMAELKNQLPPRTHHGQPVHQRPRLPATYIALFAYPGTQRAAIEDRLRDIIVGQDGQVLPEELASLEWEERFSPMKVKRLGPSLVPAEVVVPLDKLEAVLKDMEAGIRQPLVMEGVVVRGREVVILGFVPHDERSFGFNLAYGLSLSVLKIAKGHGGRAYSTGLYLTQEAGSVLGNGRAARIRELKRQVDPQGLLNPGKVLDGNLVTSFMGLAAALKPVVRALGNLPQVSLGERQKSIKGYPAEVSWYARACAQCGYCVDECTLYQGRGWESASPRGKWFFLNEVLKGKAKFDQKMVDTFLLCTTCEKCDLNCQLDLPIEPSWGLMRGELVQRRGHLTFPPFEIMAASLHKGAQHLGQSPKRPRPLDAGETGPQAQREGRGGLLRWLHGLVRRARHRPGCRYLAGPGGRGVHHPGLRRILLRDSHAGGREVGYLGREHAPQYRKHEGSRREDGGHLLPGMLAGVAHLLSPVGQEAGNRLSLPGQELHRGLGGEDRRW